MDPTVGKGRALGLIIAMRKILGGDVTESKPKGTTAREDALLVREGPLVAPLINRLAKNRLPASIAKQEERQMMSQTP